MRLLRDLDVKDKRVILRADLNVPLKDNKVSNDFRLQAVLPTIEYLMQRGAKIVLMSHLGRPAGKADKKYSLEPVARYFSDLFKQEVIFIHDCVGDEAKEAVNQLKPGHVVLLENTRFHKEEKKNDPEFAKQLAELGELYVNDAFSVSHRAHASMVGIPGLLPSCAGFLVEKEMKVLGEILESPKRPLVAIIGGIKVSTKMQVIKSFLEQADSVVLGGALANTIISAKGFAIGKSIVEEEMVEEVRKLDLTNTKMHIPVDVLTSADASGKQPVHVSPVGNIDEKEMVLDIGPDTIDLFARVINKAGTVVWSGPMGLFEVDAFAKGSGEVAKAVTRENIFSIIGGGDTIACLAKFSLLEKISHISTGGGAMLKVLAYGQMPALEALNN